MNESFLCSQNQIHHIAVFGKRYCAERSDLHAANDAARVLWQAQGCALRARYKGAPLSPLSVMTQTQYETIVRIEPMRIVKACISYCIQVCEWRQWRGSDAEEIAESAKIKGIYSLPGFDDTEWSIP